MYEVEVKARLRDRVSVIKKLEELGCKFSSELRQIDHVYIPKGIVFPPPFEVPVLRIREQNGKYLFALKISQSSRQDCIERELGISEGKIMNDILSFLNYEEVTLVDKKRIKTKYNDIEIVLDDVKELGEFVEAEKIVTEGDQNARKNTQENLFEFLETLGVQKEDRIIDGKYDIMLFDKFGIK